MHPSFGILAGMGPRSTAPFIDLVVSECQRPGGDFLAIACNTAHIYFPRLASAVSVPLLNMVELTLDAVPRSAKTVALVAARPTVESEIVKQWLAHREFYRRSITSLPLAPLSLDGQAAAVR